MILTMQSIAIPKSARFRVIKKSDKSLTRKFYKLSCLVFILCSLFFASACSISADVDGLTKKTRRQKASASYENNVSDKEERKNNNDNKAKSELKGWGHLYYLLANSGLDANYVKEIILDERMPENEPMIFRIPPRESQVLYSKRNSKSERKEALRFYNDNKNYFKKAEESYCVPSSVILSLLQIETRCGRFTGKSRVLPMLARLSSALDKMNLEDSFEFNSKKNSKLTMAQVVERAKWLEDKFLPHVIATFRLAKQTDTHPLDILGSSAGAIGFMQFLPGNYFLYGKDGDADENVDLNNTADAIASIAYYLKSNGWTHYNLNESKQKEVLWTYNRSDPYVATAMAMAKQLERDNKLNSNPKSCFSQVAQR